jgi:hypothetical protein
MKLAILIFSAYILLIAPPAHAYIDPGTGGMLIQIVIAAFLGVSIAGRKAIAAVVSKLFRKK